MPEKSRQTAFLFVFASALMLTSAVPRAHAHKLKIFAAAEGARITGYAYFPGGGRARESAIEVFGPDDRKLGRTTTDEKGEFTFVAGSRCDHRFVVQSPDGHQATWTVRADELPDWLPEVPTETGAGDTADDGAPVKDPDQPTPEGRKSPEPGQSVHTEGPPRLNNAGESLPRDLEATLESIVARHVNPLRRQIEQYEEKTRWRDVLGGIGYILGLTGAAFYFLGARRRGAAGKGEKP